MRRIALPILIIIQFALSPVQAETHSPVQNLKVGYTASTEFLNISWKRADGVKKYKLILKTVSGETLFSLTSTKSKQTLGVDLLAPSTSYTLKVRALRTQDRRASKYEKLSFIFFGRDHSFTLGGEPKAARKGKLTAQNSAGRTGSYYLPPGHNTRQLPVLVGFHGQGGNGATIVNAFLGLAAKNNFIIIAPDSRVTPSGEFAWEVGTSKGEVTEDFSHTENCISEVASLAGIQFDITRMMAIGYSAGGSLAPYFATAQEGFEAFAVLHGGTFVSGFGERKPRAWYSTGTRDTLRAPEELQSYVSSLAELGFDVSYSEYPGGHELSLRERKELIGWWLG